MSSTSRSIVVDNTSPIVAGTQRPHSPDESTTATFAVVASDTATFECQLDRLGWSACASPKTYTVPVGEHRLLIRAIDVAGNVGIDVFESWYQSEPPGANDMFANARTLSGHAGTVNGTNSTASKQSGEPNHAGNRGGKSVWFNWTAPGAGTSTVDTIGSSFDTLLAVYTGTAVNALSTVASDGNSGGNRTSRLTFMAVAGVTY